jgi:hypothetical protein
MKRLSLVRAVVCARPFHDWRAGGAAFYATTSETVGACAEGRPNDLRASETAEDSPTLSLADAEADTGDSHLASVMPDRSGRDPHDSRAAAFHIALGSEALDAGCGWTFQRDADEDDGRPSTQLGAGQWCAPS